MRLPDNFTDFPPDIQKMVTDAIQESMPDKPRPWHTMARPKQKPPDHPEHSLKDGNGYQCRWIDKNGIVHPCKGQDDWYIWLFMAGRGCGKTLAGANWLLEQALEHPKSWWAVAAPTVDAVDGVCIRGESGIMGQALEGEIEDYNINKMLVTLKNGSKIKGFSAEQPDRIRGYNLSGCWFDEIASIRYPEIWYEVLQPALRKSQHPRVMVTTTPKATQILKEWYKEWLDAQLAGERCDIHLTSASFKENTTLPEIQVRRLEKQYGGTRIGRQELEGELLEDFEGALWNRDVIERSRIRVKDFDIERMVRVVVAVDPAMTGGEDADETGIIVAGEDGLEHGYVIADKSIRGTPDYVMRRAVSAYHQYQADCVVLEANQGGDYLSRALQAVDPEVPFRVVRASRGKITRAEPISALAEQGRIHHVGDDLKELEDQLCTLIPGEKRGKDDRADAFIWAFTELRGITAGSYLDAYGQMYCHGCSRSFKKDMPKCPHCGRVNEQADEKKPAMRGVWADAYLDTCRKCGTRFARQKSCPNCNVNADVYMAQVMALSGARDNSFWRGYSGKNWFKGRRT